MAFFVFSWSHYDGMVYGMDEMSVKPVSSLIEVLFSGEQKLINNVKESISRGWSQIFSISKTIGLYDFPPDISS